MGKKEKREVKKEESPKSTFVTTNRPVTAESIHRIVTTEDLHASKDSTDVKDNDN